MSEQLYRWVKASLKVAGDNKPEGKRYEKERLSVTYKGYPDTLIFLGDKWYWYNTEGSSKQYPVHDESWSVIEYLAPYTPSPSGSLEDVANKRAEEYTKLQGSHDRPDITSHDYTKGFIDGALNERAEEYEMKRLYDWIMDENRRGATTFFTSGWLRNVAKEIEYRIATYEEVLKDHKRLVRELDEIINGKEGMAEQASLCDIVAQMKKDYVKGGEELAERYAVELAEWILHRFHSTEYDKEVLKWKWNQTLWSSQAMFERFMEEEYPDFVIPSASRPSIDIVELKRAWNLAITIANNECMRMSDDWNNDDKTEEARAANECAKRIRGYIDNPIPELTQQK